MPQSHVNPWQKLKQDYMRRVCKGTTSEAKIIIIGSPVNSDRDNKYLNPGELYCQNNKVTIEKGQPWCRVQKTQKQIKDRESNHFSSTTPLHLHMCSGGMTEPLIVYDADVPR